MKNKPKVNINIESLFVGDEPEWGNPKTELPITRALSWYSNQKDWKDSKSYTIDYAKKQKLSKNIIEKLSSSSEDLFKNLGFICRMVSRGADLDRDQWINDRIGEIVNFDINSAFVSNVSAAKPVNQLAAKSIQDRVWEQATQYINEIEGHIDNFIKTKNVSFKVYDWLVANSVKPIYMKHIQDHYIPLLEELNLAVSKQDEQLTESYSEWSKKELNSFISFVEGIIKDCEKYSGNTKTVRSVRKKKVVPADKKVSKLQYKKEDTEFKLASVDPAQIIGAKQLWVFNVKYKKLGVYNSVDDAGFGVKGTTLEGFDTNISISKTLRKPLEILPIVVKGKKNDLKKLMIEIKTKEETLTGRINSDTILIKVIK
jgi:hypothetical protein